jgi:hypothetical protein
VPFSEITNEIINKSVIRIFSRLNNESDVFGLDEFANGVVINTSNSTISIKRSIKGGKEGKVLIYGIVSSTQSNDDIVKTLNTLPIEYRINIIK